jgi:hypothetical protein
VATSQAYGGFEDDPVRAEKVVAAGNKSVKGLPYPVIWVATSWKVNKTLLAELGPSPIDSRG